MDSTEIVPPSCFGIAAPRPVQPAMVRACMAVEPVVIAGILGTGFVVAAIDVNALATFITIVGMPLTAVITSLIVSVRSGLNKANEGTDHLRLVEALKREEALAAQNKMLDTENRRIRTIIEDLARHRIEDHPVVGEPGLPEGPKS